MTAMYYFVTIIFFKSRRHIFLSILQEELERFPVQFVQEPTAIFKNDRREIYNNLILFTVMDESNKKDSQADMHIFQSVRTPVSFSMII